MQIDYSFTPSTPGTLHEATDITPAFDAETLLKKTFDSMDDVVVVVQRDSRRILAVNHAFEHVFQYPREEVMHRTTEFLYPDRELFLRAGRDSAEAFSRDNAYRGAFPMRRRDGIVIQTRHTLSPIYDEQRRLIAAVSVIQDRSEWLRVEDRLREQEELLSAVVTNLPGGVYRQLLSPEGRVTIPFFRGAIAAEMGIDPESESYPTDTLIARMHPEDRPRYLAKVRDSAARLTPLDIDLRTRRAGGGYFWVRMVARPVGLAPGGVQWDGVIFDVNKEKEAEERAQRLASFDQLTGLANRRSIQERLASLLQDAGENRHLMVAAINLDRFKFVNTSHGTEIGDRLLVEAARRLQRELGPSGSAARLGGDEFLVLLPAAAGTDAMLPQLQRLADLLEAPYRIGGESIHLTASLGVAVYPSDGRDGERLLAHAETALHRARAAGGDRMEFYSRGMTESMAARATLEQSLREAIAGDQLQVYFQPQVDPLTSRLVGLEALARWQHPERGEILPGEFIPVAEDSGLIRALGQQVLRLSCRAVRKWMDQGLPLVPVSVNLSVKEIDSSLVDQIRAVLAEEDVAPDHIELEITESSLLGDAGEVSEVLKRLRQLGLRFVLDDFGTGYSSLSYLQRFPFDKLKIDRSFIRNIATDSDQANLVRAIMAMASSLHMQAVAEGVETLDQLRELIGMGCGIVQGWVYARAMPAERITPLLREPLLLPGGNALAEPKE